MTVDPMPSQPMIDRRVFLGAGAAMAMTAAVPQGPALANRAATGDIALLREILTTLHPGLYRFSSPLAVDSRIGQLEREWATRQDMAARYLALSRFLATIQCGHSYANFYNQTKAVQQQLFDRNSRLPFTFKWLGNEMVVLDDQSGTGLLPRGTVIKTVNGVSSQKMLSQLLPYARADGGNDGKRRALLSMTGSDQFETFDIFHGLVYPTPGSRNGTHRLRIRTPGSARTVAVEVPAFTLAKRQSLIKAADNQKDEAAWQWTMRDAGVAVLRMDSWALYNSKWDWKSWLDDRLDSLNGAKGLIVDIRENEGGLDCGNAILARFADKDIVMPAAKRLVRYRKTPAHLDAYLDTWDNSFRSWGDDAVRFDDRYYSLKRDDGGVIAARGPRISLPMAVLTSAQNSSATFQFASLCKATGLGTLVGETTGGNQRGINGGAFFFARLPESELEFDVPLIGYFPDDPMPDAGIQPDITVAPTARSIAAGTDPQITAAITYLLRL